MIKITGKLAKEAILCINAKIACFVLGHVLIGCV